PPVSNLHVDAEAGGASMFQPLVRWEPLVVPEEAPPLASYEVLVANSLGEVMKRTSLSPRNPSPAWKPFEADLAPGKYEFMVVAVDSRGNTSTQRVWHFVLTPPTGLSIRPDELAARPTVQWEAPTDPTG